MEVEVLMVTDPQPTPPPPTASPHHQRRHPRQGGGGRHLPPRLFLHGRRHLHRRTLADLARRRSRSVPRRVSSDSPTGLNRGSALLLVVEERGVEDEAVVVVLA